MKGLPLYHSKIPRRSGVASGSIGSRAAGNLRSSRTVEDEDGSLEEAEAQPPAFAGRNSMPGVRLPVSGSVHGLGANLIPGVPSNTDSLPDGGWFVNRWAALAQGYRIWHQQPAPYSGEKYAALVIVIENLNFKA